MSFPGIPDPRHPILLPLALSDSCLFQARCSNFLLREEKKSRDLLCASWRRDLSAGPNSPKHLPFRNKNAFFYCPCSSLLLSQELSTSLTTLQNYLKAQPQGLSMKISGLTVVYKNVGAMLDHVHPRIGDSRGYCTCLPCGMLCLQKRIR